MDDDTKIIANPSLLQIGFSFAGILFSCGLTLLIFNSETNVNDSASKNWKLIMMVFFMLFSLLSLYMLLTSKKVTLTNNTLMIKYPLLFYTKKIDFQDIKKVKEEKYKIENSRNYYTTEIYNGKKIVIAFYESKKIEITSLEVTNYINLSKNLRNITTSYFKIKVDYYNENYNKTNLKAYIGLIIMIILSFGLFISVFKDKF